MTSDFAIAEKQLSAEHSTAQHLLQLFRQHICAFTLFVCHCGLLCLLHRIRIRLTSACVCLILALFVSRKFAVIVFQLQTEREGGKGKGKGESNRWMSAAVPERIIPQAFVPWSLSVLLPL